MKIAIYSHSIPPAVDGVSRRMASLIYHLTRDGHEVLLFTLEKEPQLETAVTPGSIPVRHVTIASTFLSLYPTKKVGTPTPANQVLIMMTMRRERPDVLHCTMDGMSPLFMLAAKLSGVPVLGSIHTDIQRLLHELNVWSFVGTMTTEKERWESKLLDSCATTSPSFQEKLGRRGVPCDHVINTGVRVALFRPEARKAEVRHRLTFGNPDGLLVVYVGRFGPEKRLDRLVDMCGTVDGVYLALIGDGPEASFLLERHGSWTSKGGRKSKGGIFCRVGFLGHEEVAPVYASADAHVSCSHFETLGNTVLEAHACGTCVVVPRTQGFVDTVKHEDESHKSRLWPGSTSDGLRHVDGFLFDGSRLAEGAGYLARLRDNREMCRDMGERGRIKVQMQSPERVAQEMLAWYRKSCTSYRTEGEILPYWSLRWRRLASTLHCLLLVFLVEMFWFCYNLPHAFIKDVMHYCKSTRNALGNSSFFNKISNTYKALSNIPVGRDS